jgi:hypothetical protein
MLTRLPPLPIVVNYGSEALDTLKKQNRAVAALRYPDRVRRIVLKASDLVLDGVYRAMKRPYPALESLELHSSPNIKFDLPTTTLRGSAPSLRHLHLQNFSLVSLSPLLSSTTGLVDLNLEVDGVVCPPPAASLLTHLQGMPRLCRLQLRLPASLPPSTSDPVLQMGTPDIVQLLRLAHFQFSGSRGCLEALAAGLAAPFLQDLNIQFQGYSPMLHLPHLSRFIRDVEGLFLAVLVESSTSHPQISMLTHSHSPDEPPRRINVQDRMGWLVQSGPAALSARLATVEQLFFKRPYPHGVSWLCVNAAHWREFFEQLRNVKILRVQRGFMLDVARFLSNDVAPSSQLLPALEEIELRPSVPNCRPISESEREEILSTLRRFVAVREQAGYPVRLYWNADLALPCPYW